MGRRDPRPSYRRLLALLIVLGIGLSGPAVVVGASGYPVLPIGSDQGFLYDLDAPVLSPGDSGIISFTLGNPMAATLTAVVVTIGLYAFNAYPGNATGSLPTDAPVLWFGHQSGTNGSMLSGDLAPGGSAPFSVGVAAPAGCPSGTFAVRTAVDFSVNGTPYRLASRGFFSDPLWASATAGPNGTSTLNLSVLGVSGVVPETGVLVRVNPYPPVLYVVLAAAFVLAAAGGFYAWRRGPRSRSGARTPEPPSQAPRAFGKSRTRDGD